MGCRRGVRAEAERREPEILRAGAGSIRRLPEVGLATCPLLGGLIWRLGRQWVENLIPSLVPQLYPYICQTFLVFFFFSRLDSVQRGVMFTLVLKEILGSSRAFCILMVNVFTERSNNI